MRKSQWIASGFGLLIAIAVAATLVGGRDEQGPPPVAAGLSSEALASDSAPRFDRLEIVLPSEPTVFYQYIDDETGAVRFVESLRDVPEDWQLRAGRVEMAVAPPQSPAGARMLRKLQSQ